MILSIWCDQLLFGVAIETLKSHSSHRCKLFFFNIYIFLREKRDVWIIYRVFSCPYHIWCLDKVRPCIFAFWPNLVYTIANLDKRIMTSNHFSLLLLIPISVGREREWGDENLKLFQYIGNGQEILCSHLFCAILLILWKRESTKRIPFFPSNPAGLNEIKVPQAPG